jgi:hypothetical protein
MNREELVKEVAEKSIVSIEIAEKVVSSFEKLGIIPNVPNIRRSQAMPILDVAEVYINRLPQEERNKFKSWLSIAMFLGYKRARKGHTINIAVMGYEGIGLRGFGINSKPMYKRFSECYRIQQKAMNESHGNDFHEVRIIKTKNIVKYVLGAEKSLQVGQLVDHGEYTIEIKSLVFEKLGITVEVEHFDKDTNQLTTETIYTFNIN